MPDSRNQTHRERLEAREEAIVRAAHAEFVENGFDGAKMAGIARRAGVAEGTLYLYFRNKNALLGAVIEAFYARLTESARAGVEARRDTADRLHFLARHHLRRCLDDFAILALAVPAFYRVNEYRDSRFLELNRAYVAVFDGVIREGISRNDLNEELSLQLMRDQFFGVLEHSARSFMVHGRDLGDESAIDQLSDRIMTMILPAFGLAGIAGREAGAPDLHGLARRLEDIVGRMEKMERQ